MSINNRSIEELVRTASSTLCTNEMKQLQANPDMNVRKALAKNVNIDFQVLEKLLKDPVQNVSYCAHQNPKSNERREFSDLRPCVKCEKDYSQLLRDCGTCEHTRDHKF